MYIQPLDSLHAALPVVSGSYLFITLDKDYLAHVQPLNLQNATIPLVLGFYLLIALDKDYSLVDVITCSTEISPS